MNTEETVNLTENYILKSYGRKKLAFEKGSGSVLFDLEGVEYLDFTSGLGVNALGYSHPRVTELIKKQAEKIIHTSNLYHIPSQAILAEKICDKTFGKRVFFCNSGAEAVEGSLKFARKWGKQFNPVKTDIISFSNSFHGRTFGALSATMQGKYQSGFEPLVPGFHCAEFNNITSFESFIDEKTVAVIIEPIQGEGGVNPADLNFIKHIEKVCRDNDILLIVDEVQCGMSRTGKLCAHEHFGITPDLMALAKPLAGGLPIGATVVGERVWEHIKPGEHASTFGGNHFVTGVALGVFDMISDNSFIENVEKKGIYMREKLGKLKKKYSRIKDVRGLGLLNGVEVDFPASEAVDFFQNEHILICGAGPNVIRFIPPLIITKDEIDRAVNTLDKFLSTKL